MHCRLTVPYLLASFAFAISAPTASAQAPRPLEPIATTAAAAAANAPSAKMPTRYAAFFRSYCLDCHDTKTREGKLDLQTQSFDLGTIQSAETWQKVLNELNSGNMPPEDSKQPTAAEKTDFLETLSHQLVIARKILSDSGGIVTMRRLNRREYINTIHELLQVHVDAADLPADTGSAGAFDTAGASLFFSSDQFQQYLALARRALDDAIVTGPRPTASKPVRHQPEGRANRLAKTQHRKLLAGYQQAQKWRQSDKPPSAFGFLDEARVRFEERIYRQRWATYTKYLEHPANRTGTLMVTWFQGAHVDITSIPANAPAGEYLLKLRVATLDDSPSYRRFLEFGTTSARAQNGELNVLGCRQVTGTMEKPQILEIPIKLTTSGPRSFGLRQRQPNSRDAARFAFLQSQQKRGVGPDPAIWIDWVEWQGPAIHEWPPKSHRQIFFDGSDPKTTKPTNTYARQIINRFARRAFRDKPPKTTLINKLVGLYQDKRKAGTPFVEAIKEPLAVILASPSFLYLAEPTPQQTPQQTPQPTHRILTDRELAIRLSYFLTSAPPDRELSQSALRNELHRPEVLARQTDRLLADPRSWQFITGFTHQWLQLDRLDFFQFSYRLYPQFDESVRQAARDEVYHTLNTVLTTDASLGRLLKSDFVVINALLADFYGIPGIQGDHFRKVQVPEDSPRGGLTGMAAILAMGSDGERSSPVERGAWVMRKLLNDPPPPAPANVPQLSRHAGKLLPARRLLDVHRELPQCAQCHRKIDPLGFGLENFNAVGRWRKQEYTEIATDRRVKTTRLHPIDPSGTMPDGTAFANYFELRDRIAEHEEDFAQGFCEALIAYGLGRPFGFSDSQLAHHILTRAHSRDNRIREFIHALVQSRPFRTK